MRKKYYEDANENAAFERCVDVVTTLILKYGLMLKRKWSLDEWIRNIQAECFWRNTASRRYQQYFKSMMQIANQNGRFGGAERLRCEAERLSFSCF